MEGYIIFTNFRLRRDNSPAQSAASWMKAVDAQVGSGAAFGGIAFGLRSLHALRHREGMGKTDARTAGGANVRFVLNLKSPASMGAISWEIPSLLLSSSG